MSFKNLIMLEPTTISIALYLATRPIPKRLSKKRVCMFIKRNKKEIVDTVVDEVAEPLLDQISHMTPSWATLALYGLLWAIIWIA
jgi:hypothetical protein